MRLFVKVGACWLRLLRKLFSRKLCRAFCNKLHGCVYELVWQGKHDEKPWQVVLSWKMCPQACKTSHCAYDEHEVYVVKDAATQIAHLYRECIEKLVSGGRWHNTVDRACDG